MPPMDRSSENQDPKHEQVHKVYVEVLEKYKAGRIPVVRAVCGKQWSPTLPFERPNPMLLCATCFPGERKTSIAR